MRLLLSKDSRKKLFDFLKEKYNTQTFIELSKKMNIPFKTLKKWIYAELYISDRIIPKEISSSLEILDKKEDNWGAVSAGKIGGKRNAEILKRKLGKEGYSEKMRKMGKKVIKTIWKRYNKEELIKMTVRGKIKKRELQSKELELENNFFFTNIRICFNLDNINFSSHDKAKKIILPYEMSEELAEEIGIHLGDGCMSFNRNYFSVKTNKTEESYVTDFLFPLYKKLYNIDLRLMQLPSVSGFEICSKSLCEFKNRIIGLPYGEKVEKIEVPKVITDTRNKEIYKAFIRGLFDTDGCIYMSKKGRYPLISITIKSEKLIKEVGLMLKQMGFIPQINKYSIVLSGVVMLKKWIEEINSNNPKKIKKLERASSITRIVHSLADNKQKGWNQGSNPCSPI